MATKSEPLTGLEKLFVEEIRDLYDAEKQLVKALPKMAKAASSPKLSAAFTDHLGQTRGHVERLESVFQSIDFVAKGKKCAAMEGLVEEGKEIIEEDIDDATRDAGLIGAAQKVEHYEIASYGTAIAHARRLGYTEVIDLLKQTLDEEKEADELLTELAETEVNLEADDGTEEDDEDAQDDEEEDTTDSAAEDADGN